MMQAQHSASLVDVSPPEFTSFSTRDFVDAFDQKLNFTDNCCCSNEENQEVERELLQQECNCRQQGYDEEEVEEDDEDGHEFSFVCGDGTSSPISADDIFQNGKIKPIFPLFGTEFAVEQILDLPSPPAFKKPEDTTTDTEGEMDEDAEGVTYCLWSRNMPPPTEACRKSNSTGFSKLRRFRELLLLQRSQSDGKDAFVFLTEKRRGGKGEGNGKETETRSSSSYETAQANKKTCNLSGGAECKVGNNSITADQHRCASEEKPRVSTGLSEKHKPSPYREKSKTASSSGPRRKTPSSFAPYGGSSNNTAKEKRRSYLPYRQDLVGFFTSASSISRNVHPY